MISGASSSGLIQKPPGVGPVGSRMRGPGNKPPRVADARRSIRDDVQAADGPVRLDTPAATGPLAVRRPDGTKGAERASRPSSESSNLSLLHRIVGQVVKDEGKMERMMRRAIRGRIKSIEELLSLQMTVYRYAQQVEMLSKVVDRATQAVKQTLQTQL